MALILLEGLDRTGKSTIAKKFEEEGYEIIHLSAPDRKYTQQGYTGPSYLDDMIELIQRAATRDIVLDRTHYGELIWPQIYNRKPMLTEDDIDIIREMEDAVGVRRILMHDPEVEAHWQRCVDNKEPLTRPQFMRARTMYDRMANKYQFEKVSLAEIDPDAVERKQEERSNDAKGDNQTPTNNVSSGSDKTSSPAKKSKEQAKLEKANAINQVLARPIVKGKGPVFDEIEKEVRNFLNKMLGTILGTEDKDTLSQEEIFIIRAFVKRLKEKEVK